MRKLIIATGLVIGSLLSMNGQSIDEAFRYSQLFYGGTARFQAMGGAFTSLGGDLSVLSQNPAGLAVFRSPAVSISPQMYFNNSEVDFGDISQDNVYDLNLNQAGVAFPMIRKNNSSGLVSLNIGYSYSKTNNYNENAIIKGTLNNSSMVDYFMDYAQGTSFENLSGGELIVFDVWMFDTISGGGGLNYASVFSEYGANANSDYGQTVRRVLTSEGNAAEHSFSLATNFNDKIFLGFTFGISSIYSYAQYEHVEDDNNNLIFDFNNFTYSDVVETYGKGYSAKLGAIIKPVSFLRLGFAVHSPVVYRLNEYYYDSATGSYDNGDYYESENEAFRFSYTLTTPLRVTTGAALQVGKKGIVSADYEFVDYKMARYSNASDDYNYYTENQDIKEVFDVAHNLRFGAEYRLTSSVYLRGGYALYGSGFARGEDNEDNKHSILSGGIGVRQSNFYFDLSYAVRSNKSYYFMYGHPDLDPAEITYKRNMLTATLGIRL